MSQYDWLLSRLDAFIRKYYANQLLRGALILLICALFYILAASLGEYFFYLPVAIKVAVVGIFALAGLAALIFWILLPLARMARLGKVISREQAAGIVGTHFPEISDKLLNILQLSRQTESADSRALIEASINQKAAQLSVVPITKAVDLSKNRKYLPFLLPLLLAGIFILVAAPNVFRDASERLLQPTRTFEKPAPFRFEIISEPLLAVRNTDFALKAKVSGNALPAELYVQLGADRIPMQALGGHTFQYTFRNVTEPVSFRLFAAGYSSQAYTLKVAQKPVLKAFKVHIDYPGYTGRKDEVRNSLGDMTLPVGTGVSWAFMAEHTDAATLQLGNGPAVALPRQGNMFGTRFRFMNDTAYTIALSNSQSKAAEQLHYRVQIIPDQHPVIQVQEFKDTVSGTQVLLNGTAGDDYGISRVLFHYQVSNVRNEILSQKSLPLKNGGGALVNFQHYFDVQQLHLLPGQKLSYYIEAWDNDGVNGSKATRSEVMTYRMYDEKQIDSAISKNAQQISSGLSNSAQQTQQLHDELKELQSKMLQSDDMSFEQKQSLQELAEKQDQIKTQLENIKKRFEEQRRQSEQKEYSQDLRDKQDELQKQMDNLLNKELQEQMKKLQELMKRLNKDQAFQTMQQLEQENKLFNMDLQRMQELMKRMEMQMRMEDLANKMDQLAKEQMDLKQQTDEGKKDNSSLGKEQQELRKELQNTLGKDMKEMQDLNKQMQQQQNLEDTKDQGKQADQNMQQSEQQLGQDQKSKSSESQSKAAQNMQEMAAALRQAAGGMDLQQIKMDIRAVRQILTNLMRLSFDQEKLMRGVQQTSASSQTYLNNQKEQSRLHGNSRMIRDSLFVLSKRLFKLAATVNKETTELERNMGSALSALEERRIPEAAARQQYVMTHTNNLALMLNEMLSNLMQMQSQAMSQKQGSCNNPGGAGMPKPGQGQPKPGAGTGQQMKDIITGQQNLGNAMQQAQQSQQARQARQQGQKPGQQGQSGKEGQNGGQGGQSGSEGEYGDAEQLARLANQQAELRRQLQQLNSLLNSKGMNGSSKELREIQEKMDRNESDLVNRRFTPEFLARQKEILTRLLEAEKSLREQEQDDKRSSRSAEEIARPVPPELQKYLNDRRKLLEWYKTVPAQLKPYYRNMVEQYYKQIGAGQ